MSQKKGQLGSKKQQPTKSRINKEHPTPTSKMMEEDEVGIRSLATIIQREKNCEPEEALQMAMGGWQQAIYTVGATGGQNREMDSEDEEEEEEEDDRTTKKELTTKEKNGEEMT